jgi:hypothetical protein
MRHKTLLAILIAFVVLSLACGACGLAGEVIEETGGDEDSPAATSPPSDKPDEPPTRPPSDAPPSGEGIKGIPLYPGATEAMSAMPPQAPGAAAAYQDVEGALYETRDDKDKVCDFYEDKMPKAGWDKVIYMPVDEGCITSWVSKDGKIGATVVVAEQPDGTVYISMVAGKTE